MVLLLLISDVFGTSSFTSIIHILLLLSRLHIIIMSLYLFLMTRRVRENVAVQLWSHNWPMESNPVVFISGTWCWVHMSGSSVGILSDRV